MPIGVFDSGLGGLTILEAIRRRLPQQDFIYFGDNANAPYGTRTRAELYNLTIAGVERLFAEGCGLVDPGLQHRLRRSAARPAGELAEPRNPPCSRGFCPRHRAPDPPGLGRQHAPDPYRPARRGAVRDPRHRHERRLPARAPLPRPRRDGRPAGLHRPRRGDRGRRSRARRRGGAGTRRGAARAAARAAVGGARLHPLPAGRGGLPRRAARRHRAGRAAGAGGRQPGRLPRAPPAFQRRHRRGRLPDLGRSASGGRARGGLHRGSRCRSVPRD